MENENDKIQQTEPFEAVEIIEEVGAAEEMETVKASTTATTKMPEMTKAAEATEITESEEGEVKREIVPDLVTAGNKRMDTDARWYVLHTFSGYEAVAEDNLKKVIEKYDLQDRVFEIFIPTEDTVVEKRDKKVLVSTKSMPSYIFVKMVYGDDIWHTITRTRGITGFVGPKGRPLPLTSKEVIGMKLERKPNMSVKLAVKDSIQIIDGPLAGQTAVVTAVDTANGKCSATVNMFGRPTSVELYAAQIKKIS